MPPALPDPSADLGLDGARAVVTGGTRGIGAATVSRLAAAGAHVVAIARSQAEVPAGVHLVTADLTTPGGTEAAAAASLERLGGIDVLIDNAGRNNQVPDGVLAATDDDWQASLEANLLSVVRVDRALVPHMTAQGHGAVVHVSSNAARYPQPNGAPYAAAKAALNSYSKSLALACGPHGVRVTAVMPGVIETGAVVSSSPPRAPPTSPASPSRSTEDSSPPSEDPAGGERRRPPLPRTHPGDPNGWRKLQAGTQPAAGDSPSGQGTMTAAAAERVPTPEGI